MPKPFKRYGTQLTALQCRDRTRLSQLVISLVVCSVLYECFAHIVAKPKLTQYKYYCAEAPIRPRQPWNDRKKVIAFSLFTPDKEDSKLFSWFMKGLLENVEAAKLYYPEWIVRVYTYGITSDVENELLSLATVEVVRCHESFMTNTSSSRKMMSRFLTYDYPDVEYTIVRDADSRLNPRELFAVNEWMSSGLKFHSMRDHDEHYVSVLGGMFGIKRGAMQVSMASLFHDAFLAYPDGISGAPGEDQAFLTNYVWPLVKHSTIAHDMNEERCHHFGARHCLKFPVHSPSNSDFFVGAAIKPENIQDTAVVPSLYNCSVVCTLGD